MVARRRVIFTRSSRAASSAGDGARTCTAAAGWATGVGWAAAGSAMTPFDGIVENPWGPLEEVRQVPVEGASVSVGAREGMPAFHLYLTRTLAHDGSPGDCCPRNFCESALKALEAETGWTLWSAFEHEFTAVDPPFPLGAVYSVESLRYAAPFAAEATAALRVLGLECFEPEFGKGQFEVSCAPRPARATTSELATAATAARR